MKIIYISHLHLNKANKPFHIGGIQRMSHDLLEQLKKQEDLKVIPFLCYADRDRMLIPATIFWIRMMLILPGLVVRHQPEAIVFTSMVTGNLAIPLRVFGIRTPLITIAHGHDVTMPSPWYQFLLKHVTLSLLDGIITVSRATRKIVLDRGFDGHKAVVISNGMNFDKWNGKVSKRKARNTLKTSFELPLKKNTKILLTVGRMVRRKGHVWFIEKVLPKIKSDFVYLIIGHGVEYEKILKAMQECRYKDRIFLLGSQPDSVVKLAYHAADLFIMPNVRVHNDMEGFGLVMLEANASKTAVVASDLEGIKDVIANGENGYRIKYKNSIKFSEKIDELLSKNEYKKLGKYARDYALANFSWSEVAQRYVEQVDYLSSIKRRELFEKRKDMITKITFGKVDYEKVVVWVSDRVSGFRNS